MTTYDIDLTPTTKGYINMLKVIIDGTANEDDRQWCIAELNRLNDACEA